MTYDPVSVVSVYIGTFAARNDVYSQWVPTPDENGQPLGWRPVRATLTPDLVLGGLKGQIPPLSGFLIAPGSTSHIAALDCDGESGMTQAMTLAAFMSGNGLPACVESSRRGAHLWCILDAPLPARSIRRALRALLQAAGLPTDDPKIELRPGSDTISDDGLGHALRLPMMPHPKTGQRGKMTDHAGAPLGKTVAEILLAIDLAPATAITDWAERWKPPVTLTREYRNPHSYPTEDGTASSILIELWGVLNAAPGRSVRCPAHADKIASLSILRDDQRVICKAPSCPLNNEDRGRGIHELRTMAPRPQ